MNNKYKALIITAASIIFLCVPLTANAIVFSVLTTLYNNLVNEASAWAISVKQSAIAANQMVQSKVQSTKTLVEAMSSIKQSARINEAMVNYSSSLGQPLSTQCREMNQAKAILKKIDYSDNNNIIAMHNSAKNITEDATLNTTADLVENNKYDNKDNNNGIINLSQTLAKDNLSDADQRTAQKYIKNVIKPIISASANCSSRDCKDESYSQIQHNSYLSIAANSLNSQLYARSK
jgi:hypothetical protein